MGPPGRDAYDAGHIPGAHFVDLDAELAGPPGDGGRHPLPSATVVEAALRRAGVGAETPVVVYDAANSMAAARAWWILRYFGVRDVRVLDGGFAAWRAAGGEVSTTVPADAAGDFVALGRPGAVARRISCRSVGREWSAARCPGAGTLRRRGGADG